MYNYYMGHDDDDDDDDDEEEEAYEEGGDCASRIAGNELDLHVDPAEEVLVLGLEAGAGILVKGKREEVGIVEELPAAIPPTNFQISVHGVTSGQAH